MSPLLRITSSRWQLEPTESKDPAFTPDLEVEYPCRIVSFNRS